MMRATLVTSALMAGSLLVASCGGGGGGSSNNGGSSGSSSGGSSSGGSGSGGGSNSGTLSCTLLATGSVFNPSFNDGYVYQLLVDASNVYWYDIEASGSTGTIKSVPKSGGAVTVLASGLGGVNALALDDTSIYWAEHDIGTGAGSIKSVPKSGGQVTVLASGTPAGSTYDVFNPQAIAVDSAYVYWADGYTPSAIRRVPKLGGSVTDINRGGPGVGKMVLDSTTSPTTIYFTDGAGTYYSTPIAGGAATVLATGAGNAFGDFVVDGTSLYNSAIGTPTGNVFSIPLSGGAPVVLASNLQNPHNVASDGTFLYFSGDLSGAAGGPGAVVKIAKSGGAFKKGLCAVGAALTAYNADWLAADASNVYIVGFVNPGPGGGPIGILKVPAF